MNARTPVLRAHLLAELRDVDGQAATTEQLALQTPNPYFEGQPAWGQHIYPHLRALANQGLIESRRPSDGARGVLWQLVA